MAQRIVNMFLSVLAAYGTLILTKHMSIADNIFVTQIVRLIICVVAVIIVTGITTYIFRNKSSNK
ncbi:hypothetical protein [Priestia megaterium]|jgi:hypothetical protein|uniref:Uncharacterized protein n=1 Tax=Priestia megaterium TaxID=1404 RepID=A0A6M6E1L8_PRIMG|nr:hypothetical protein [Priestia megaterium]MCJ7988204.1 hypothetical protein [Priestia sp. OVS21]KLV33350.1 hypothetical protein ABW04_02745 [Priestia megaterium]MCE4089957.1 hypothetical protein [Priestia megaterium]MDH3160160.1 hypothetical protein [Priestia megaterium]MED4114172.1 hypothetical protein [Priestia megaterium]